MKKKIAIYPGSFNPWHNGHEDILKKALKIFDRVIIVRAENPEKGFSGDFKKLELYINQIYDNNEVKIVNHKGLLSDLKFRYDAIIRGLRNGYDLQYEMNQQYWYEDTGIDVPIVLFICDRNLTHISSTAIRALRKLNSNK